MIGASNDQGCADGWALLLRDLSNTRALEFIDIQPSISDHFNEFDTLSLPRNIVVCDHPPALIMRF